MHTHGMGRFLERRVLRGMLWVLQLIPGLGRVMKWQGYLGTQMACLCVGPWAMLEQCWGMQGLRLGLGMGCSLGTHIPICSQAQGVLPPVPDSMLSLKRPAGKLLLCYVIVCAGHLGAP